MPAMSRSARLFDLLQVLRRHRLPVSGRVLAAEVGVSLRTLYRDIATLQAQGAHIEGEPGVGYVLRPGFMLPPLMFTEDEIEALVLGSLWVAERTDHRLRDAARNALARIAAVLPDDLRAGLDASTLLVAPPAEAIPPDGVELAVIRQAIRAEVKLEIGYRDGGGAESRRLIWPFGLAFFDSVRIVLGWCELRQDYRHFRVDRIASAAPLDMRYPRRRHALMKEWKLRERQARAAD